MKMTANEKLRLGFIPAAVQDTLAAQWDETLARLRTAGYTGIEMHKVASKATGQSLFEATGMDASAMRRSLDDHGVECCSWFANWGDFGENTESTLDAARTLGVSYIVWGWASPQDPNLMAQAEPAMHEAAAAVREAGMTLLYHNHDHEFLNQRDGHCAYDWLMDRFDPSLLQAELDVGWVACGGQQNVATIERYADRIPILHLRDLADCKIRGSFVELGQGELDLKAILDAGLKIGGTRWGVIEYSDVWPNRSAVDSLVSAADYVKACTL